MKFIRYFLYALHLPICTVLTLITILGLFIKGLYFFFTMGIVTVFLGYLTYLINPQPKVKTSIKTKNPIDSNTQKGNPLIQFIEIFKRQIKTFSYLPEYSKHKSKLRNNKDENVFDREISIPARSESDIKLPEKDTWETDYLNNIEESIPINLLTLIEYRDSQNQYSKRRITIKKLMQWGKGYAILAFCHERNEHRTFKLSGILSMCDLETGELIDDPYTYLTDRYNDSPLGNFSKLMKVIENEVLSLVFIAKSDGRMTAKERKIIVEYINHKSEKPMDESIIDKEVKGMY
ncbi:MAG: hypothetical protein KDK54_22160 [Leptospiraceae bacterium]|nr:hypothetical protein [Leptospiraceae bacterium]